MNSDPTPPSNTVGTLLRDLRNETTTLLQQEVALAKAEIKENVASAVNHGLQIAVGGFVAYAGVIVLLIGLGLLISSLLVRAGMSPDLAQWLAPAALGLVVALIGAGMMSRAKHAMASEDIIPGKTVATMRENKDWAQRKLQHSP